MLSVARGVCRVELSHQLRLKIVAEAFPSTGGGVASLALRLSAQQSVFVAGEMLPATCETIGPSSSPSPNFP